jgi:hypothetical protein
MELTVRGLTKQYKDKCVTKYSFSRHQIDN